MNSLKEFIMEQNLYDIQEAQIVAEMNVLTSMLDCYNKQSMIMESCTDANVSEFSIFSFVQEADDATAETTNNTSNTTTALAVSKEKKKNVVVRLWQKFTKWLRSIIARIKEIISRTPIDKLIAMAEKCPDDYIFTMTESELNSYTLLAKVADAYTNLIDMIKSGKLDSNKCKQITDFVSSVNTKTVTEDDSDEQPKHELVKEKFLEYLHMLKKGDNIPSKIDKLDKELSQIINAGALSNEGIDLYAKCQKLLNSLIEVYNTSIRDVISVQKKIIKSVSKNAKTGEKNAVKFKDTGDAATA